MTTASLLASTPHLDLKNPRQYLIQDLFDSDSEESEEEEIIDQPGPSSRPAAAEQRPRSPRVGGVALDQSEKRQGHEDEGEDSGVDEYEAAAKARGAQAAKSDQHTQVDDDEKEVPPTALQSDRSIQDSLSGELLRMAGILKANSMAFADALERDRKILEDAGEKLQGNLTLMTKTRGKLGEYSKKARGMGWATLGSVAIVCISWVIMFILIRLT